jgi:RNA polymerase sigma-70 factor (ECF subfamily)
VQYLLVRLAGSGSKNDTQEHLDFRLSEKLFKEAVTELTAQKQLIFRLKHEEGLSYEEIAQKLNLSKNTVRNHLAEALQIMRAYLLKHGVFLIVYLCDPAIFP